MKTFIYLLIFIILFFKDLSNGGLHLKYEMRFDKLLMGVAANPESREQFVVVDEDLSVALIQSKSRAGLKMSRDIMQ